MRVAAALLLLTALQTSAQECVRSGDRCRGARNGRVNVGAALTLDDIPLGLANQCNPDFSLSTPAGLLGDARADAAYCPKSDGTVTLVQANKPRVGRFGLLAEPARTQLLTNVRDWSHADWVKSNMTCTKTATGADGVANAASTCTASANNGTAKQAFSGASVVRAGSFSVRRRTGSGTVSATIDDGTTWCDVTTALFIAMANGCQWLRLQTYGDDARDTAGVCYTGCGAFSAALTSYGIGLRLGTSGDAVDVDFAQLEPGLWQTSPIAGASRSQDLVAMATGTWPTTSGFFETVFTPQFGAEGSDLNYYVLVDSTPASGVRAYWRQNAATVFIRDAVTGDNDLVSSGFTGGYYLTHPPPPFPMMRPRLWRFSWSLAADSLQLQGRVMDTGSSANPPTTHGTAHIGALYDNSLPAQGWFSRFRVGTSLVDDRVKVATIGDSILDGANAVRLGEALQTTLGWGRYVVNPLAVSGTRIATGADNCTERYALASSANVIVYNCGINDLLAGTSGADTWTASQTLLNAMRADGKKIVLQGITPCGGYGPCNTAGNVTYNASAAAWCTSEGAANCYFIDSGLIVGQSPGYTAFRAACDLNYFGSPSDKLHPGDACSLELVAAEAAGVRALQ
jgi:hypothetical protein